MDRASLFPLLVVEDNDEDFFVFMDFLNEMEVQHPVHRCIDGDDALDFLWGEGNYQNQDPSIKPSVVLLDLNLPGTDGREVLEQIKGNNQFKQIPVVIFTTSHNPQDIDFCYQMGANSYLVKPMDFEQMRRRIKAFVFI